MAALAGTIDEWVEIEPSRWARYVYVAKGVRERSELDGVVTLREGLSFSDYWEKRATPPAPEPDARDAKIADLETLVGDMKLRLEKLEETAKVAEAIKV